MHYGRIDDISVLASGTSACIALEHTSWEGTTEISKHSWINAMNSEKPALVHCGADIDVILPERLLEALSHVNKSFEVFSFPTCVAVFHMRLHKATEAGVVRNDPLIAPSEGQLHWRTASPTKIPTKMEGNKGGIEWL